MIVYEPRLKLEKGGGRASQPNQTRAGCAEDYLQLVVVHIRGAVIRDPRQQKTFSQDLFRIFVSNNKFKIRDMFPTLHAYIRGDKVDLFTFVRYRVDLCTVPYIQYFICARLTTQRGNQSILMSHK